MNKKLLLCALGLLLSAGTAFSQDFGLTFRSLPVFSMGDRSYEQFDYTGTFIPWFAAPLGEQGDVYLSGGISLGYSGDHTEEEWKAVPELYRSEIAYRFGSGLRLAAGRLSYREPLGLVCNGLFDGLALSADLGKTRLAAGAFYTGLLYKKTAYITMSPGDYADYYDDDVYFGSRRLVFSLGGEIPSMFDTGAGLDLGIVGQIDLNEPDDRIEGDAKIHSQYALAEFTLPFLKYFNAELGALLGIIEEDDQNTELCFAASAGLVWLPPGGANDRLSLGTVFSSGAWSERVRAFLPINTIAQGKVLRPNISGLALTEGEYAVRLHPVLSAVVSAAYFFRTDSHTYSDPDLDGASLSPLLGGEVYGGLTLSPVSDISFTMGWGAFFPQFGRAFKEGASTRGRVSLEMILSF
jgi:hypothetical protein